VAQPSPPESEPGPSAAPPSATPGGTTGPARLDTPTYFATHQAEDPQAPLASNEEAPRGAGRPVAAAALLRELLRDDEVMAALADAGQVPAPVPVTPADVPAHAEPAPEKDGRDRLPAAWLLVPALLFGLVRHWGRPSPHGRDEHGA
jgi:hypothetical protein